jgi:hypothetical protein
MNVMMYGLRRHLCPSQFRELHRALVGVAETALEHVGAV